jgi:hypothetical protein
VEPFFLPREDLENNPALLITANYSDVSYCINIYNVIKCIEIHIAASEKAT